MVTNDDGVYSSGLSQLADALHAIGEVYVVAPDRERNATSHALTLHRPLRVEEIRKGIFSVNGTPTDCVNVGVLSLLHGKKPDLVVSGINKGGNLGEDVTYSGTVAAAMEGTILGIPSFAVSQLGGGDFQFEAAAAFAARLASLVLKEGLEAGIFLNVNVPDLLETKITGVRITSLGRRISDSRSVLENMDPRGRKCYWIGVNGMGWENRAGTDCEAMEKGAISITPLHLNWGYDGVMKRLNGWRDRLLKENKVDFV